MERIALQKRTHLSECVVPSVFFRQHDGKNSHRLLGIGGIIRVMRKLWVVVVDLEEHAVLIGFNCCAVVFATGVIYPGEAIEPLHSLRYLQKYLV